MRTTRRALAAKAKRSRTTHRIESQMRTRRSTGVADEPDLEWKRARRHPARAFANRVIQPQASCFYRHPLRVCTCLTWVRGLLRKEHLGGFWPVMISKKKRPPFGQPLFSKQTGPAFHSPCQASVLVLLTALVPVLAPALASGPRSTGLFKPTP